MNGSNGANGGGGVANPGLGGAGGFDGGSSKQGINTCSYTAGGCSDFVTYLNGCAPARAAFPFSINGTGPGRGFAGGETYVDYATDNKSNGTATGGGGASHATLGEAGEDRNNQGASPGTAGPNCSTFVSVRNSGVVGVRGQHGALYGDAAAA
ncbi:MAG: hypothetical protein HC813_01095, partial [Planctomycetes bacterium]|nr:hypothetical protein [Planctomycetota bacterium]